MTSATETRDTFQIITGGAPQVDAGSQPQLVQAEHRAIEAWKISKRTCREYDYTSTDTHHYANFKDENGLAFCQHVRTLAPKGFRWVARPSGVKPQLFGQHLGSKGFLIITEGEKDALCIYEALEERERYRTVVVSIPDGAQSAAKAVTPHLKWISGFNSVTIFFDMDEPGLAAAQKTAQVIGPKTRVVQGFQYKDAGEAWIEEGAAPIRLALSRATVKRPDAIVNAMELNERVMNPDRTRGHDLPWMGWNGPTEGLKPGEVWLVSGGTGIGKSLFTRSMALNLARRGVKVAYLGYEESVETTYERMLSEELGRPFHLMSVEERAAIREQVVEAQKAFAPNLFLIDKFGSDDLEVFISDVKHYVLNEECSVVVLDHFSLLADGIDLGVDQRRAIDKAIKDIKTLAMELKFTFVVVCHLSRNGGAFTSHEEGGEPSLADLRGSHSLAQIPDYIWMLQRNPKDDDKDQANITKCWLKKNRVKGEVGHMASLQFIPRTCRFTEVNAA